MKRFVLLSLLLAQFALAQSKELTIASIYAEGGLTGRAPETIKWSPDGTKVSFVQRDDAGTRADLFYVDVATGNRAVLVAREKLAELAPPVEKVTDEREKERLTRYSVAGYHWAPDSKHLLFDAHGQLWLYSLETGKPVRLTSSKQPSSDPKFSPDGRQLAFLRNHDLWVRPVRGGVERQLTRGGSETLLNGEVDWVYAEELDVRSNWFWSPDGKQILFLQMDQSKVPTYPIVDWIPTHATADMMRYPKAGDPNPRVRLGVIDVATGKTTWLADRHTRGDVYVPRFGFVRPGLAWVQVLNRAQDRLDIHFIDTRTGRTQLALSETEPNGWIEVGDNLKFSAENGEFLWTSWRNGSTLIYKYTFNKANPLAAPAKLSGPIVRPEPGIEILDIEGVKSPAGPVYATGIDGNPRERHVVMIDGKVRRLSTEPGTHSATFNDAATYYVDHYSATMTPPSLRLCKVAFPAECRPIWQARKVEAELVEPRMLEFKAADGKTTLYGSLLLPPGVPAGQKVPVILNPYGGPHGQVVANSWGATGFLFDQVLARRGFAVLKVDNRGMGARGRDFATALRLKFGEVEMADQLAALDQALAQFPQLDAARAGFWGWSYGGYMTLYAMTHSDRFRAGVSVAPVSDWRNYDTIYTERYMGLPKENPEGYKRSSPVHDAKALKGRLLLVHGTSDDNVHLQNTVQMANALIEAGIPFDLQVYPRKTHGIAGRAARTHLFERILAHFESYLRDGGGERR